MSGCMCLKCYVSTRYHIGCLGYKKKTTNKGLRDTPRRQNFGGQSLQPIKELFFLVAILFLSN